MIIYQGNLHRHPIDSFEFDRHCCVLSCLFVLLMLIKFVTIQFNYKSGEVYGAVRVDE